LSRRCSPSTSRSTPAVSCASTQRRTSPSARRSKSARGRRPACFSRRARSSSRERGQLPTWVTVNIMPPLLAPASGEGRAQVQVHRLRKVATAASAPAPAPSRPGDHLVARRDRNTSPRCAEAGSPWRAEVVSTRRAARAGSSDVVHRQLGARTVSEAGDESPRRASNYSTAEGWASFLEGPPGLRRLKLRQ
jgi:hypothetical protein